MRALLNRPYLIAAILVGIVLFFVTKPWAPHVVTRALIGWDGGVIVFIVTALVIMSRIDGIGMRRWACSHDAGAHFILFTTIAAAVASVGALISELSKAQAHPEETYRVVLAAMTVVLSWLFTQMVFSIHYAHHYYLPKDDGDCQRGLEFGQPGDPDYLDFIHFALVIGATSQTADVTFTSRRMRRIGTLHTLVAFGFNTAILATMINLASNFL